jgi:Limiting CO2-inducible proteins B/C beta carbonyic anhydrases
MTMKIAVTVSILLAALPSSNAFAPLAAGRATSIRLQASSPELVTALEGSKSSVGVASSARKFADVAPDTEAFSGATKAFPGALSNADLKTFIREQLKANGYNEKTTLVATSLCCDEVNRPLETELIDMFNTNFNMGGLAGFPFGGATSFGAMAAHIPDGGSCIVVYGPHVGVDSKGNIGTVERRGRAKGGACCGSAVAASNYVAGVLNGEPKAALPSDALDAQQYFVGSMLMPFAKRLESAKDKMVELPYALYDAQTDLMNRIVAKSGSAVAGNGRTAVLGGIQINTPPGFSDYFLPLSFEIYDSDGNLQKKILGKSATAGTKTFSQVEDKYPGALTNAELLVKMKATLSEKGYNTGKTLVATSLCCDEVNRPLESDLAASFNTNFNMGGLAGFPFGGATSFGAMASHIPDGGDCVVVYGPHVGIDFDSKVGTVPRRGKASGGSCCGSAVAASGYVAGVKAGGSEAILPDDPLDAQQFFVGSMLMPYADRLEKAADKMQELPLALYDAQTDLMKQIIAKSASAVAGNGKIAVLGGVQINTPPGYSDYFLPKSFNMYDNKGNLLEKLWK